MPEGFYRAEAETLRLANSCGPSQHRAPTHYASSTSQGDDHDHPPCPSLTDFISYWPRLSAVSLLARVAPFWPCRCLSAVNCTKHSLFLVATEKKLFLVTSYLVPCLWGGLEWSPRQRNLVSRYLGQLMLAALEARI